MRLIKINIKDSIPSTGKYGTLIILSSFLIIGQTSCKKFVEIPPPDGVITSQTVYTGDATAIAALNGIYVYMNLVPIQGAGSLSMYAGLSADEYTLAASVTTATYLGYYRNALSQIAGTNPSGGELYSPFYTFIFKINAVIEGLNASTTVTPSVKQQLLGEAKFMRALFYFYMVNLFEDVPLALTTDPKVNTQLVRSSKLEVYDQVVADLLDAEEKLSDNYLDGTLLNNSNERTRPTKWASSALLSRVYLYYGNLTGDISKYTNTETEATKVIGNASLFDPPSIVSLNNVFLKNSREAIWQIQPYVANFNTSEARSLIIPSNGPSSQNPVYISKGLLTSFENGDQRAVIGNWINRTIYSITSTTKDTVYCPFKYKLNSSDPTITNSTGTSNMKEYFMVLRVGEQYLIRAEARARQGNISGAQSDLNAIRNRAGLSNTTAGDQSSLVTAILNERRHELFSEWGNRWLDLKRTGNVDAIMTTITPQKSNGATTWQSFQQLYPIPITELQLAPNITQNDGY